MHILFVDDFPEQKISYAIEYLKKENVDFSYEVVHSLNSAHKYLSKHIDEIDLAIIDLGLPLFDNDSHGYDRLQGLRIVAEILYRNKKIPIIINSTTKIPNEENYLASYRSQNVIIEHVAELDGFWLYEFINLMPKKPQ